MYNEERICYALRKVDGLGEKLKQRVSGPLTQLFVV